MSVEDLLIHFEHANEDGDETSTASRQYFMPGDTMTGTVSLHLRSALRVRGLTICFLGTASVSWEAQRKRKVYQASEIYLESLKPLLDLGYSKSVELDKGLHQFQFRYLLPTNLPSSFVGVYGQLTYIAKAMLDSEDERNTTVTNEPFLVLRRPTLTPAVFNEKSMKKSKFFLGWNSGKVTVQCTIDRCVAVPGDNITIDAEIINWTGRELGLIQAALILQSRYCAQGHEIYFRQYLSKRDDVYDVDRNRGRRWRHVLLPVPPFLADSGLTNCSIIDIEYFFQFKVQIEGKEDIVLESPVYVGINNTLTGRDSKDLLLRRMWQGMADLGEEDPYKRDLVPWYEGRSVYGDNLYGM